MTTPPWCRAKVMVYYIIYSAAYVLCCVCIMLRMYCAALCGELCDRYVMHLYKVMQRSILCCVYVMLHMYCAVLGRVQGDMCVINGTSCYSRLTN